MERVDLDDRWSTHDPMVVAAYVNPTLLFGSVSAPSWDPILSVEILLEFL